MRHDTGYVFLLFQSLAFGGGCRDLIYSVLKSETEVATRFVFFGIGCDISSAMDNIDDDRRMLTQLDGVLVWSINEV